MSPEGLWGDWGCGGRWKIGHKRGFQQTDSYLCRTLWNKQNPFIPKTNAINRLSGETMRSCPYQFSVQLLHESTRGVRMIRVRMHRLQQLQKILGNYYSRSARYSPSYRGAQRRPRDSFMTEHEQEQEQKQDPIKHVSRAVTPTN